MLSLSVQAAVSELQQQAMRRSDRYNLDRLDRALDELVRSPEKIAPPAFQCRSALANAGKVLRERRNICAEDSLDEILSEPSAPSHEVGACDAGIETLDIRLWLETTPSLTPPQRDLLRALAAGHDAESLASRYGLPVARIRERISRARKVGWAAYQQEMGG